MKFAKATPPEARLIREFAKDIRQFGDLSLAGIADPVLANEFKTPYARAGKLSANWIFDRSFFGRRFLAVAIDPVDKITFVLFPDGRRLSL